MRCPCCGANLTHKGDLVSCEYCGYEEVAVKIQPKYNLLIKHSNGQGIISSVRIDIPDSGAFYDLAINTSVAYKLISGPHKVKFSAAGRSWTRIIVIPNNNEVVIIDFSYINNGSDPARILINQPNPGPGYEQLYNGELPEKPSKLSTIAFCLALMLAFPTPALIMSIIDMAISKSKGKKVHRNTQIAFWLSITMIFLWSFAFIAGQLNGR